MKYNQLWYALFTGRDNCPADVVLLIDASYREGIRPGGAWDNNIKTPAKAVLDVLVRDNPPRDGNRIASIRLRVFHVLSFSS